MKHAIIACLAGISLMACTPASEPAPETPADARRRRRRRMTPQAAAPILLTPPADACGATQYQALIGKPITEPGVPAEGPDVRYIRPEHAGDDGFPR